MFQELLPLTYVYGWLSLKYRTIARVSSTLMRTMYFSIVCTHSFLLVSDSSILLSVFHSAVKYGKSRDEPVKHWKDQDVESHDEWEIPEDIAIAQSCCGKSCGCGCKNSGKYGKGGKYGRRGKYRGHGKYGRHGKGKRRYYH
mmetsp:Transcript_7876/g.29460  ORF Transcript_7876/g.29460 Transcript_7876/m.29460 type:complete len:142 (+) Transcript_7876:700-1125(+)